MRTGMFAYLIGRLVQSLMVLLVIVTLLFLLFRLGPSNPLVAYIDTTFTAEQEQALTRGVWPGQTAARTVCHLSRQPAAGRTWRLLLL